jgi:hypothetical protein
MRDLLADRASPLKRQSESEPDWMQVIQRLETYLSEQSEIRILNSVAGDEVGEERPKAERIRSFATPFEAAQLRTSSAGRSFSNGRAEDAAARVGMSRLPAPRCKLTLNLTEPFLGHVAEETTYSNRYRARYLCRSGCDTQIGCLVRLPYDEWARGETIRSCAHARPSSSSLV